MDRYGGEGRDRKVVVKGLGPRREDGILVESPDETSSIISGPCLGSPVSPAQSIQSRPDPERINGFGLTSGDGLVNGLGLTELVFENGKKGPNHVHLFSAKGFINGLDGDSDGFKNDRALINGISLDKAHIPIKRRKRMGLKSRKHKAMMERVRIMSELPIEHVLCKYDAAPKHREKGNGMEFR